MRTRRFNLAIIGALFFALVLVATSCSFAGSDDSGADTAAFDDASSLPGDFDALSPEQQMAARALEGGGDGGADAPVEAQPVDQQPVQQVRSQNRDIIFTADMALAVTDVDVAGAEATRIVESLGGFVFGQDSTVTPVATTVLTFRIDPASFQEALDQLGELGTVRTQSVDANDVTGIVIDLESRITTAEASVERLRTFLENATTVEQVAALERELLDRETELETMRGQLRMFRDQISLATIVVRISEALSNPALHLELSAYPGHEDAGASCPGDNHLAVDEGAPATLCFQLTNVGDTALTNIELADTVLDVELADLIVVFGDPAGILEPGQTIDLAYEVEVARDLRTQTRVSADPVNADGEPVSAREVAQTSSLFVTAVDPGGLPGFGDGLAASWELLRNIAGLLIIAAGAVLPFVWVIPLVWLVLRSRRRSSAPATDRPADSAA